MEKEQIIKIILMVLSTFSFVALIMPLIKKAAVHVGAMDVPKDDRRVHTKPIPRMGGMGIFLGFLFGYMIFGSPSPTMNSILIGSFIIILLGLFDDIKPIPAKVKLLGQLAAALIVVFYGGIVMTNLSAFGYTINFYFMSYPITIFFILGCVNCMNLIDGLDGLSGGISAIYFLTIGIIAAIQTAFGLDYTITFIMLGSLLGFLIHNFNPASIFAGDCGSMFMGFMIAIVALLGFKSATLTSLIIPLLIIAIPILDTLFAILRRTLKGESISTPDKYHIHHQLLKKNLSQRETVLIIYLIDILFALASIIYFLKSRIAGYVIYGLLITIVLIFVIKTDVVFEHKDKKDTEKENKK